MKVILEPTVTPIAVTKFIEHPVYKIPSDGSDDCKLGSFAAKGCYNSFGENGRSNIENQNAIKESHHGSVVEHGRTTFFIEGISRSLSLEMNRHRPFSISQRSTRYTEEEDSAIVLEPYYAMLFKKFEFQKIEGLWVHAVSPADDESNVEFDIINPFLYDCEKMFASYKLQVQRLIKRNPLNLSGFALRKWARGKARNILPHCLETQVTYTNNHRGWRFFIEERSAKGAEPEIRRLADVVLIELRKIAPEMYSDFSTAETYDNIPVWVAEHKKI